mgnify:CR=1 FL=1
MGASDRFKYNFGLELAMWNLFGRKQFEGEAASFESPPFTKECLLKSVDKIRKRLLDIPMDERLTFTLGNTIDSLEYQVKEISESKNNDWALITELLNLIVLLLGFDRCDGKTHRNVIFFQTKGEEQEDARYMMGDREYYDHYRLEEKRRVMLVNQLYQNKVPKHQIASLLGLSIKRVNQILGVIAIIEKENGRKIPKFE